MSAALETLVANLRRRFEQCGLDCAVHATHISVVLLAGEHAYKFKRAVDLGFVDFSTLQRRRECCERELAFNRRIAPELYERVAAVTGSAAAPELDGDGEAFEYAVVMRRFPDDARLDVALAAGRVDAGLAGRFGAELAAMHAAAEVAAADAEYGSAAVVAAQLDGAFAGLDAVPEIEALRSRAVARGQELAATFEARRAAGRVRACHGDLHLANVMLDGDRALPFDCIEFDDSLRMVDVFSDVAFLLMDLDYRGEGALGNVFLNAWLDASGDYAGLPVLRFYTAYRAVVRAKISELQCSASAEPAKVPLLRAARDDYLALARCYLDPSTAPGLVITHGVSGSGKSRSSRALASEAGFIHLRSDRERLRLDAGGDGERYSPARTEATYARLQRLAGAALEGGLSVVVDATFLERRRRETFAALARHHGVSFAILDCDAEPAELRRRVRERQARGDDASEATVAVLERQLRSQQPLTADERRYVVSAGALAAADDSLAAMTRLGAVRPGSAARAG